MQTAETQTRLILDFGFWIDIPISNGLGFYRKDEGGLWPFVNFSELQRLWPADAGFGFNPKPEIQNPKSPEANYG